MDPFCAGCQFQSERQRDRDRQRQTERDEETETEADLRGVPVPIGLRGDGEVVRVLYVCLPGLIAQDLGRRERQR